MLLIYYTCYTNLKLSRAYKSKHNNEHENQVILLMIIDGIKWHYLALKSERIFYGGKWCNHPVKSLSKLLRTVTSNHRRCFYCLNCLNYSCSTENKLKEHEKLRNKHICCCIEMPRWFEKILKSNHGENH